MATTRHGASAEWPNNSVHNSTDQLAVGDDVDPNFEEGYEVEDPVLPDVEENYSAEYSICSYGADYPVDGLVERINSGSIYVPRFQRSYVWNIYRASRFIESLLLGLPVPSIFLYKESESNKLLVIDGQQRLRTLQYFYMGRSSQQNVSFDCAGFTIGLEEARTRRLNLKIACAWTTRSFTLSSSSKSTQPKIPNMVRVQVASIAFSNG